MRLIHLIVVLVLVGLNACLPIMETSPEQEVQLNQEVIALLARARRQMSDGSERSLGEAEAALSLASELSPNDPRVVDGYGCVEWHRGNYKLAEYYFKKSVALNPYYDRGYAHLALLAEFRGDIDAAQALLQTALAINPLNYRARNNYGLFLISNAANDKQFKQGYEELLKADSSSRGRAEIVTDNLSLLEGG